MPMYEYQCQECGKVHETLVRGEDDEKSLKCPDCGSTKLKRVLSMFSGSGGKDSLGAAGSCAPSGGFS